MKTSQQVDKKTKREAKAKAKQEEMKLAAATPAATHYVSLQERMQTTSTPINEADMTEEAYKLATTKAEDTEPANEEKPIVVPMRTPLPGEDSKVTEIIQELLEMEAVISADADKTDKAFTDSIQKMMDELVHNAKEDAAS